MSDSAKVAAKVKDCLDADYFSGAIENWYVMVNHIRFLEQQVSSLKATIARLQSDMDGESECEMGAKVGHLPDPYRLDVAYADGRPVGTVEKIVMDEPNPDRLGPYIRQALRDTFEVELSEGYSERWEA